MKQALMFDVCGRYGFFKNHESNSVNMTYQFIPKPCIMGLLGSIIGLDGWRQMRKHDGRLEYYEVFKNSKIAIIPREPYFEVFYETINNCTGFENRNGATANIKRQILQDPYYTIIIQKEGIEERYYNKLKEMLLKGESIYPVCLGNNTYKANIINVKEIELNECNDKDDLIINSLILESDIEEVYEESQDNEEQYESHVFMPIDYNVNSDYGHHKEQIIYTNHYLRVKDDCKVYEYNDKIYHLM
jgi:CRISPR-associated protein Cas5h